MIRRAKALFVTTALVAFFGLTAAASADVPATLTIDAPSAVSYQSAHVSGTVDPEGNSSTTYWRFEYSTNPSDPFSWAWSSVSGELPPGGTDPVAVGGTLEYLQPGTEYAVRLVAAAGGLGSETEAPYPTFTTLTVAPPTVTLSPPSAVTARTAHFEADIDPGGNDPAFNTSWFFSCTPACPGLEGSVAGDGAIHHISVDASNLQAGTDYEVTLYASNVGGTGSDGPEVFTTSTEEPTIQNPFAHKASTEATLGAEIDPGGLETTYYFEYGTTSAYGHSTPVKTLPAGGAPVAVSAIISGLSSGSTYHYRVVAENADGAVESGDRGFTTLPIAGLGLPDGRGYELVSSEDGNLGAVLGAAAADQGGAVVYSANAATGIGDSVFLQSVTVSNRSSDGWVGESLDPKTPQTATGMFRFGGQVAGISEDFRRALVLTSAGIDPLDVNGETGGVGPDFYLVEAGTGAATWITKGDSLGNAAGKSVQLVGASRDLRHIYFEAASLGGLYAGDPGFALYEWANGTVKLASILPDGTPAETAFSAGAGFDSWPAAHGGAHPVSDDGSTMFFRADAHIYARHNGSTIDITPWQRSDPEGVRTFTPRFIGASHDGDLAYFEFPVQLTESGTPGGGIYSYRISTGELTQLTPDPGDPNGLGLSFVPTSRDVIMSDDASHVYFISTTALTGAAQAGEPNLYVLSGGQTRFLTTVAAGTTVERTSRSGRFALLQSTGSLAGADPAGHVVIYRYDDQTQDLLCVSCRTDGAPSGGDSDLNHRLGGATARPRNITDDGTVFFASNDQLVPGDVTQAWDVYEFTEGAPHLLTTGRSQYDSYLSDNTDDGSEAFFITRSALVSSDRDEGLADLYSARIGGGFPEPSPAPAECMEDSCQGELKPPAAAVNPGSRELRLKGTRKDGAHLIFVRKRVLGNSATLTVRVDGPGKLTIRGRDIKAKSRRLKAAGVYQVRVFLDPPARKALRQRRRLVAHLSVRFKPNRGRPSTRTTRAIFKA